MSACSPTARRTEPAERDRCSRVPVLAELESMPANLTTGLVTRLGKPAVVLIFDHAIK
jgi:hypothetical protein